MVISAHTADELTNSQYHGDKKFFSSSQLKTAVESIELFYKEYILGEKEEKLNTSALDVGSAFHCGVLEPHKFDSEVTFYLSRRAGKEWEKFAQENKGKIILTEAEMNKAKKLIKGASESKVAQYFLTEGEAEFSVMSDSFMGLPTKVRADYINVDKGYISDLKSTSGAVTNTRKIQTKISELHYDLSAALYMDVFNQWLEGSGKKINRFIWVFVSSDSGICRTYEASEQMLDLGRAKYRQAINQIRVWQSRNWNFQDELVQINPVKWDVDQYLLTKDADEI